MSAWDEIFYGLESGDRDQALAKGAERRQAQERAVSHNKKFPTILIPVSIIYVKEFICLT